MIHLSSRLSQIFDFVPCGAAVCDVGTDHGYLPAALAGSGRASRVIATDIRQKPLQSAREHLAAAGIDSVELRLCDGLSDVKPDEVDTVIVAGMGGEVIAGILERAPWVKNKRVTLILQPMTSAEALREYLSVNGFAVIEEPALSENGKVYSVMLVTFTGVPYVLAAAEKYAGKITAETADGRAYIEKQHRRCRECADHLGKVRPDSAEYQHYKAAADQLLARLTEDNNGI
ncbi:MAG: class I SAM-dependent methyltransferase [Clostridia bacterium]|nr:class I SAM-dependent methyltransferase [Clostridia bacterium]